MDTAPARLSTRAHSSTVAPVVITSSTITTKGPADIALARRRPEVTLCRCPPTANQPIGRDLGPARGTHRVSEQRRLVVAALEEPGPVQRHRDEQIGAREDLAAGTVHPFPKRGGRVSMVAVLEGEQQAAAVLVVAQHRARLMPSRRLSRTVATDRTFAHRMGKRQTAKHTPRRRKEGDPTPAACAQGIGLIDNLTTGQTARRQHTVDERPADPSQSIGRFGGKGCRSRHDDPSSGCPRVRQPEAER